MEIQKFFTLPLLLLWIGVQAPAQETQPQAAGQPGNPSEIIWDEWGVPHIYADNESDLFFAQGWAQMHLHGDQILKIYGKARGKAAEYWGAAYLPEDILVHTLDFPEIAQQSVLNQDPLQRKMIRSFVDGMNAYAKAHPEAIHLENQVVLPVQYEDIHLRDSYIMWIKWITRSELNRLEQSERGSNAYAIGPARSANGHAMLVQNPHVPWSGDYLFVEMHLNIREKNIYGSVGIGAPGVLIAFNHSLGWTFTVNTIDNVDTYELELDGEGYLLDGKTNPFSKITKTLKVKEDNGQITPKEIQVLQAKQGPILKKQDQKAYAIRMPVAGRPNERLQLWKMATSSSFDSFEDALKMMQVPWLNIIYADQAGTIFYLFNGLIPERKSGGWPYWSGIIPGSRSEDIWTSTHPYDDLPKVKNPAQGWLQNSNDPPWSCTFPMVLKADEFPPYFAPRRMDFRNQRAVRMIDEDPSITFEELIDYKHSTRLEFADRILDDLFAAIDTYGSEEAKKAKTVLERWDRQAETSSVGTELFTNWTYRLLFLYRDQETFAVPWSEEHPRTTPDGLADPERAVEVFEESINSVKKRFGSLTKPYGEMLRLRMNGIDLPGNGAFGGAGAFRVTFPAGEDDFRVAGGDSYVGIVEFGDRIRAKVLLSHGNSSREGSPHYGDQLQLFSEKKLRDAYFYREDVMKHIKRREVVEGEIFANQD